MRHRCSCGQEWWIEEDQGIQREPGLLACDCGQQIEKWDGSVSYSKIRMCGDPTVTTADLVSETGVGIPAGSTIEVLHLQTHQWNREAGTHTTFRKIRFAGNMLNVIEEQLFSAIR